ncbi:UDP-glucose 4-epimerase GalE [Calditerrivibrio nitroreducens]|uniref:UDP-glucose 4-epimerase n=1 Tax=Calditerrivibrio nitroreducens (strain DSM 19672 / NBRC 101217 / Yu37-1) TaxID=768670 RepID=E4TJ43_CALNY|nr:UDP-glucose 4-epimerase GalE [Calditerrivibrio nitroreducens]ADR18079.1 UDP-galactose 4-epimerase [Calditerrivibrio nitroreducens DSM 19672]
MNILVTGGAGYIGSHVVKQLLENTEHHVTIIDNLSTGLMKTVDTLKCISIERLKFLHTDLKNFSEVEGIIKSINFDAIIHFAASIVVPESVENPLKYYLNNTVNTTNLINLAVKYGINRFIFSSTAAVYGEPEEIPVKESSELKPINPYGMSKLMSENVLIDTAKAHKDFKFVILRYFNVAGADTKNRIGQSFPNATHLIKVAAETAIGKREKLLIFGEDYDTKDGTCIRDYIHVDDLADAHLKALEYLQHNNSDIFNCGYGYGYTVKEVINTMKKVSGVDFRVETSGRRPGDPAALVADNTRIKEIMKWKPNFNDLELICKTALEWEKKLLKIN